MKKSVLFIVMLVLFSFYVIADVPNCDDIAAGDNYVCLWDSEEIFGTSGTEICEEEGYDGCKQVDGKIIQDTGETTSFEDIIDCEQMVQSPTNEQELIAECYTCGEGEEGCYDQVCWDNPICKDDFCNDEGDKVVWSYTFGEINKINNDLSPSWTNCVESGQCLLGLKNTMAFDEKAEYLNMVCNINNNWEYCTENVEENNPLVINPGEFSSSGTWFCTEEGWIMPEADCTDGESTGGYEHLADCLDPTCDGKVGAYKGPNCINDECYCEFEEEKNCEDWFDNDRNEIEFEQAIDIPETTSRKKFLEELNEDLKQRENYSTSITWEVFQKGFIVPSVTSTNPIQRIGVDQEEKELVPGEDIIDKCTEGDCLFYFMQDETVLVSLPEEVFFIEVDQATQFETDLGIITARELYDQAEDYIIQINEEEMSYSQAKQLLIETPLMQVAPLQQVNTIGFAGSFPDVFALNTDCRDPKCIENDETGPGGAKCCSTDNDCGIGAECNTNIYECVEIDCDIDSVDEDGDGDENCADSDCATKICKEEQPFPLTCQNSVCKELPKSGFAPTEQITTTNVYTYKNVLNILNQCTVERGEGTGNEICETKAKTCIFADGGRRSCSELGSTKSTCC